MLKRKSPAVPTGKAYESAVPNPTDLLGWTLVQPLVWAGGHWRRFKEHLGPQIRGRPRDFFLLPIRKPFDCENRSVLTWDLPLLSGLHREKQKQTKVITLGGGSLGSCVDEERSQLRELM